MGFIVNVLMFIGSGVVWLFKKFIPFLSKKFGLGVLRSAASKVVSALIVSTSLAFYSSFIIFVVNSYNALHDLIDSINDGSVSFAGGGADYIPCIYNLLNVSGIASGFSSAFSFGVAVFAFLFLHALYTSTIKVLSIINEQIKDSVSFS